MDFATSVNLIQTHYYYFNHGTLRLSELCAVAYVFLRDVIYILKFGIMVK